MAAVHARYLLIKSKATGVDALVDRILANENPEFQLFSDARQIYNSTLKKSYVESCMLATQSLEEISRLLEIPLDVLTMYRRIFFNVEGFDKLSKLEVVDLSDTPDERGMKMWALSQGLDFIRWRLGKAVSLNPVEGLKEMFTLATYKSKEALFSGNASESSKEAAKWTKLSMDLARLLKAWVMDTDSARKDIELALKTVDPSFGGFDNLEEVTGAAETPTSLEDSFVDTSSEKPSAADTSALLDFEGFEGLNEENK